MLARLQTEKMRCEVEEDEEEENGKKEEEKEKEDRDGVINYQRSTTAPKHKLVRNINNRPIPHNVNVARLLVLVLQPLSRR